MGPYQSIPTKTKHHTPETGVIQNQQINAVASETQGWRNGMEDSHICSVNIGGTGVSLFGIFDGHGGKEVAKYVEKHFVPELLKLKEFQEQNFGEALTKNFMQMDRMMETEEGQKEINQIRAGPNEDAQGGQSYAGCTANVALFFKNELYVANAGDSRAVLCRSNKPYAMSQDHKPDNPEEKSRITEAGGFVSEGRVNGNLNLSRAMGDLEYKNNKDRPEDQQLIISKPDIQHTTLSSSDRFLLMGCDGIWECKTNEELIDFCRKGIDDGKDLQTINTELLDEILAPDTSNGTGCDNMSLILINFTQNW